MYENDDASAPVRIIIADDHPLVLLAIENLMSGFPKMEIAGRASDTTGLFAEADRVECNLAVLDLHMPGAIEGDGFVTLRQFRKRHPHVALVVLTMETDANALQRVISLGAEALVSKRDRIDLIHVAIVSAMARERYVGPAVRALIADATRAQRIEFVREMLTPREQEVLTQYASGISVTEIATRLGRSIKTISSQKCAAMRKLALASDSELFRFAVDYSLLPDDFAHHRR